MITSRDDNTHSLVFDECINVAMKSKELRIRRLYNLHQTDGAENEN